MGDALATWFEAKTCVAGHIRNMRGGASTRSALALAVRGHAHRLGGDGVPRLNVLDLQKQIGAQ